MLDPSYLQRCRQSEVFISNSDLLDQRYASIFLNIDQFDVGDVSGRLQENCGIQGQHLHDGQFGCLLFLGLQTWTPQLELVEKKLHWISVTKQPQET